LSRRSNFISKEDKREILLKERRDSLEYSKEIAVVYEIIKDLAIKQRIQSIYKRDARAKIAKAQKHEKTEKSLSLC
jgi:hypothetical protein